MSQLHEANSSGNVASEELKSAEKAALSFVAAFKYYSLYPKGHTFSQNYLHRLLEDLEEFLKNRKSLRLDIERYTFFYKGQPLFKSSTDENNPAYLLTRDRIMLLEFTRNIQLNEITALFDILNTHRNPLEEVDGDIATSLWHIPFNNIHYEAADIFAMEAIDFELSMFNPLRMIRKQVTVLITRIGRIWGMVVRQKCSLATMTELISIMRVFMGMKLKPEWILRMVLTVRHPDCFQSPRKMTWQN